MERRATRLGDIANNNRYLILSWVQIPHLASHVLGRIARRIRVDWIVKYGHPVSLLETFVDRDRFRGICYRAANWHCVGADTGEKPPTPVQKHERAHQGHLRVSAVFPVQGELSS